MQNGLQLSPDKSEAHQLRTVSLRHQFVTVADVDLPLANEMKVFGVILDRHLTFEKHVSAVARSCNYHYHNQAICHIHHLLTTQLAQTLAYSLILSGSTTATLCSMAFHPATSRSYSMFRTVQHGSPGIILQAPRRSHTKPILHQLHWLTVQYRITYKLAVLTYCTRSRPHRRRRT